MLATIRDDTWNVLNMQHITSNSKRWDYSDIPGGKHKKVKDPNTSLKEAFTLEKPPTPTHMEGRTAYECLIQKVMTQLSCAHKTCMAWPFEGSTAYIIDTCLADAFPDQSSIHKHKSLVCFAHYV